MQMGIITTVCGSKCCSDCSQNTVLLQRYQQYQQGMLHRIISMVDVSHVSYVAQNVAPIAAKIQYLYIYKVLFSYCTENENVVKRRTLTVRRSTLQKFSRGTGC